MDFLIKNKYLPNPKDSTIFKEYKNGLFDVKKEIGSVSAALNLQDKSLQDRIEIISELTTNHHFDQSVIKELSKSKEKSESLRQFGNTFYSKKEYDKGIICYNFSITFAPTNSPEYNLALANRSALFLALSRPEEALKDLNLILESEDKEYPKKIIERRDKCIELIRSKNGCKGEHQEDNQNALKYCQDLFTLKSKNDQVTAAEDFIKIETNELMGRHLIATRNIRPGETIIVEKPFAKVLLDGYKFDYDHCHYCLKPVDSWIPCDDCVFAVFCSKECKNGSRKSFHQYDCKTGPFLYCVNFSRNINLSLRIVTFIGSDKLFEYFTKIGAETDTDVEDKLDIANIFELDQNEGTIYDSTDYKTIYNLISHPDKLTNSEIIEYSYISIYLVNILEKCTTFFSNKCNKSSNHLVKFKKFIASIILNHIQNLPCNAHSLNEMKMNNPSKSLKEAYMVEYGAGAYPLLSLLNHSCDPNVTRFNLSNGLVGVVAIKHILKNHEIFDNYGSHFALSSTGERKKFLKDHYYFECNCAPCMNNWPTFNHLKTCEYRFRCSDCYLQQRGTPSTCSLNESNNICQLCYKNLSVLKALNDKYENDFDEVFEEVLEKRSLESMPKLLSCLEFFELNINPPYMSINNTQETYKQMINSLIYFAQTLNLNIA